MREEVKSKIYQLVDSIEAISEADNNETTDWEDFKKEMNEWKTKQ